MHNKINLLSPKNTVNADDKQHIEDFIYNSRKWFFNRYLYPHLQRVYLIVCLLSLLVTFYLLYQFKTMETEVKRVSFIQYALDQTKYINKIRSINNEYPGSDINAKVASYILKYYIKVRENYTGLLLDNDSFDAVSKQIMNLSSRQVYSQYLDRMDLENPESPMLLYRNRFKRDTQIDSITMRPYRNHPSQAVVKFRTFLLEKGILIASQTWLADIVFTMNDCTETHNRKQPIELIIIKYKLSSIDD